MDRQTCDKARIISNEESKQGYMNAHFQLFCIFEDFYNKLLGKNNAGML